MVKVTGLLFVVVVIVIVEALSYFLLCFHRFSLFSLSLAISLSGDSCHLSVGVVNNGVNFFKDVLLEAIGHVVLLAAVGDDVVGAFLFFCPSPHFKLLVLQEIL